MNSFFLRTLAVSTLVALTGCGSSSTSGGNGGNGGGATATSDGGGGGSSSCEKVTGCTPGATADCGCYDTFGDDVSGDGGGASCISGSKACTQEGCKGVWSECMPPETPLVFSFDDAPIVFESSSAHAFELTSGGTSDWPSAATPWLALDRDGSGTIDAASELFGSKTPMRGGHHPRNGFEALAELDENHDGQITAADSSFAQLVIWRPAPGSATGESISLAEAGIVSIDLAYHVKTRCDIRGNCEGERASFAFKDGFGALHRGSVVDVHLTTRR